MRPTKSQAVESSQGEQQSGADAGTLVMLVGPPASGKSYLARLLVERLDGALLQTDVIRKAKFRQPRYTSREHAVVYAESRRRITRHLRAGRAVIFDATNLEEKKRQLLYKVADQAGARLLIALVYAPVETVRLRLAARQAGLDPLDRSDADLRVYLKMGRPDPISRPHLLVNSGVRLEQSVELIARRLAVDSSL